jgi:uncharacterized membrane protein
MLTHIVSTVIMGLFMIPGIVCIVIPLFQLRDKQIDSVQMFLQSVGPLFFAGVGLLIVAVFIAWYFLVAWFFALPLVMDKGLDFWPALQTSRKVVNLHWWKIFGLIFVLGLMVFASVILCCLPVLIMLPVYYAAMMYAYEDIFGQSGA